MDADQLISCEHSLRSPHIFVRNRYGNDCIEPLRNFEEPQMASQKGE
jgi:hypothetical protein